MNLDVSTRDGYDIACALRGPDFINERYARILKNSTTAVLRSILGLGGDDIEALVVTPDTASNLWLSLPPHSRNAVRLLWRTQDHFRQHFLKALAALRYGEDFTEGQSRVASDLRTWVIQNLDAPDEAEA